MKKRLVFFIYVDVAYRNSKIYDVHFYNLKQFRGCFDCCTFWLSLKDFSKENIEFASEIVCKLLNCGYLENTEFKMHENDVLREARCFDKEIFSHICGSVNEVVFFGHTKGLSNTFNDSVLVWITSMYYFGLNFKEDIDSAFYYGGVVGKAFYGFPLMKMSRPFCEWIRTPYMYAGTFYWTNTEKARRLKEFYGYELENISDRGYAETFPSNNFNFDNFYTHKEKILPSWDLYSYSRNGLEMYFGQYYEGDIEKKNFYEYYDKMISELNIEL